MRGRNVRLDRAGRGPNCCAFGTIATIIERSRHPGSGRRLALLGRSWVRDVSGARRTARNTTGGKSLGIAAHGPQTAFCASGRDAARVAISTVEQGALNRVQHHVEILAHVFSEEA